MIIKKCGDKIIEGEKSIFLMGPISSFGKNKWYNVALSKLEELNYDGVVYVPYNDNIQNDYPVNAWRMKAIKNATVVAFWVPRKNPDMLGLDVNLYFGQCLSMGNMIYGRPDDSYKNKDLDEMYFVEKLKYPFNNLDDFCFDIKGMADTLYNVNKLDLISYFKSIDKDLFENVAKSLSKEEYDYIIKNLLDEKRCSNCTTYCTGGSAKDCNHWNSEELVGKAKVLGSLKK